MAKPSEAEHAGLLRDFREWLVEEKRERDDATVGIFAARMTNYGLHKHRGFTEKGICVALGGDPYAMD